MSNTAQNNSTVGTAQNQAIQVNCRILSLGKEEKQKNYADGSTGLHVWQQIQITEDGPMKDMIIPASRTTLNKEGVTAEVIPVGKECVVYLREAVDKDGVVRMFGDLGSGLQSTDTAAALSAFQQLKNMKQAM